MNQKIALVTGGNRGIGLEICRQLAAQGIEVILGSRTLAHGQAAAAQLPAASGTIHPYPLDVADPAQIQAIQAWVTQTFGRLDILVNNAAIYPDEGESVFDLSIDLLRQTMTTNLEGPLLLCQAFVPLMRRHNYGRVVNVSSGSGALHEMGGRTAAYRLSKVALNALTRIIASEVQGTNIKVNALCPGWVRTEMGGPHAPRTVAQGADTAIWLATLPDAGPTNGFFRDRKPIPW